MYLRSIVLIAGFWVGALCPATRAVGPVAADWVIKGGTIVDGTGTPGVPGDLAIKGDRIVAIGRFEVGPEARVVDAAGRIVAPGFIDLHSHSDGSILSNAQTRSNLNYLTQGVTTIVTGNCGGGPLDVAAFLTRVDREKVGTNVIHLVPHGAVRRAVMGTADRRATPDELAKMKALVEKGLKGGAWGMSTGLIYVPSRYGDTAELIELARIVAAHGGIYASHIRGEGTNLLDSIDEALRIGREANLPVQISHLKASGKAAWGLVRPACARIAEARAAGQRVVADQYPYVASSTSLGAMVVPDWALQGNAAAFAKLADDPVQGPRLRREIERNLERRDGGAAIRIARYAPRPSRVGKGLDVIARAEGTTVLDLVLDIQRNGGAQAISFSMSEEDVRYVMKQDFVATASDGSAQAPGGEDRPHPRAYGTFPRKFRYALDDKVITLEQAVRSSSALPAESLGLPDRGTLRVGAYADVVVFDPRTFRDNATFDDPKQYATGVQALFVNGVPTIARAAYTGALAGRALRLKEDGPADTILKVGRIWTGDPSGPWAEALAIRDGAIVAVGRAEDVEPFHGARTATLEHPGAFAMPGLIDSHGHITSLGPSLEQIDLRGVASLDEVARRVRERIAATPGDSWIIGHNWDQSLWPGGEFPTRATLDAVAPDRPVWLTRVDGHAGWANSEALRRARITADAKAPPDGQIHRDAQGEPTGVFIDGAMGLVARAIPNATRADLVRQVLAAQHECLKAGLTSVHEAGLSRLEVEVFRQLDREGKLKLRVYGMASPPSGHEVEFVSSRPVHREPGRRFELRAIKLFIDGAMGSRGGLLFEPYSDDPGNVGLQLIDENVLEQTTVAALRHGWQVCTHAIGDKGNALVLDAYANALKAVPEAKDARLRIEHAQVVRKADVERFRSLGIIASMQPSHASTDKRWADARLGPDRVDGAYAWGWFRDAGVKMAFGSDFPVEVVNPFWGLFAAITRQDESGNPPSGWHAEHLLTLEDALRYHTAGSAYAAFEERRLGTLEVGKRADITVIDRDPFKVSPGEVLQAKVTATIIDGEPIDLAKW